MHAASAFQGSWRFLAAAGGVATALGFLAACGGGGGGGTGPSGPSTPTTTQPPSGETVEVVVFFDEDADGVLSSSERARVPGVGVVIGGRSAASAVNTGTARVVGVARGTQQLSVDGSTLPPFYVAPEPFAVEVPAASSPVPVPLTLPIADTVDRNVYMAFGDSITMGTGATPGAEYPTVLQGLLGAHFAEARVTNRGDDGTDSFQGIIRILRNIRGSNPSHTLILYGSNDWNDPVCKAEPPCYTAENLRTIVQTTKEWGSLPFVATLPPANPALEAPPRNEFYEAVNVEIAAMAAEEGAFLVDLYTAFAAAGDLPSLFSDHIHPNDAGYRLIAQSFFEAIAHGRATPSAARARTFGWSATPGE